MLNKIYGVIRLTSRYRPSESRIGRINICLMGNFISSIDYNF